MGQAIAGRRSGATRARNVFIRLGLALMATALSPARATTENLPHAGHGICADGGSGDRVVNAELAGVPAILRIPARVSKAPIILWHGFGPPASEQALMQAFPLDAVPAVKVYLGLPMFGKRTPAGGTDELIRRQREDVGLLVFKPVVVAAADELPRVIEALKEQHCMRAGDKIGLLGFSAGGASVLLSLAGRAVPAGAAVLLNPSTGLTASIEAFEHATGLSYAWTSESRALAKRADAIEHVAEIARGNPPPAILFVRGEKDDVLSRSGASELRSALESRYAQVHQGQRFRYSVFDDLPHNLSSGPALDELHRQVSAWFNRYLH